MIYIYIGMSMMPRQLLKWTNQFNYILTPLQTMSQRPNQKRPSQYALELKRSYTDHKLLQKDPFILDNDFYHSRHIRTTPF